MNTKKIAVVMVLCAAVVLVASRREESYEPLKLGGPRAAARALVANNNSLTTRCTQPGPTRHPSRRRFAPA